MPPRSCMRTGLLITMLLTFSGWVGCKPRSSQAQLEIQAAASLSQRMAFYQNDFPDLPITNIAQLFEHSTNLTQGYPHFWDRAFRAYGTNAGFTNSFYEKYVLVPAGVRHRHVKGEVVLLNAKPFPDHRGQLERMIVSRTGPGYGGAYVNSYPETTVQEMFRQAGISIPAPARCPAPPPAPATRKREDPVTIEGLFRDVAESIGLQRSLWLTVLLAFGTILIALVSAVFGFWWVRKR